MIFWDRLAFFASHFWPDSAADIPLLLTLLLGWWHYRRLTTSGRIVLGFVNGAFVLWLAGYIMAFQHINNHFTFTLQALLEFGCFGSVYLVEIKSPTIRRFIGVIMGVYLLIFLVSVDATQMNDWLIGLARLILIGFVLTYFWSLLIEMKVMNLLAHPPFWVSVAVLLNCVGTVFIFLFNQVTRVSSTRNPRFIWYWGVTQTFLALFYCLLIYSFWLSRSKRAAPVPSDNSYP